MRIRSVTAHAFGPLAADERLELADGLTVVVGDNESAKSTWHAAIYAAFCGRRRKPKKEERSAEQLFKELHRPWDRDDRWAVSAIVDLDDGRQIELYQDLETGTHSRAMDLGLNKSCAAEITDRQDGSLDAALWLGLNSRSFTATACVNQAQLALAAEHAASLQEFLDRAVATAGADETTATAFKKIDEFRRDEVGTSGYRQPLPKAKAAVDVAETALNQATAAQVRYKQLAEGVESLRNLEVEAKERFDLAVAAAARQEASTLKQRLQEAEGLARTLNDAPSAVSAEQGASRELIVFPEHPAVTMQLPQNITDLAARQQESAQALHLHEQNRPQSTLNLSADFEETMETTSPTPSETPLRDTRAADVPEVRRLPIFLIAATVLAVIGIGLLMAGVTPVGGALLLIALVVAGWTFYGRWRADQSSTEAHAFDRAKRDLVQHQLQEWTAQRETLAARHDESAKQLAQALTARGQLSDAGTVERDLDAYRQVCQKRVEQVQQDWGRLRALLGDGTLDSLRESAAIAAERVAKQALGLDSQQLAFAQAADSATLEELRVQAQRSSEDARVAEGELRQYGSGLASVAEAEEARDAAMTERDRLIGLGRILDRTREFLEAAQEEVHRDIAPALVATLRPRLTAVTAGRYTDAIVNPKTLEVSVYDPQRRERHANLLSHGTKEQVYLLLRLAIVERLTADHETCPLLLDDVTVHADAVRTERILDLLLQVAEKRQVVVFTQEQQVADWARIHLVGPRHGVRELAPLAAV